MRILFKIVIVYLFVSCSASQNLTNPTSVNSNTTHSVSTNDLNVYSVLLDKISNDYRYINEKLLFIYDEKYNNTTLTYKIYSKEGKEVYSNIDKPVPIEYGRNYVELSFPKSTYRNWGLLNPLLLEVIDSKNQKQYLKFVYSW